MINDLAEAKSLNNSPPGLKERVAIFFWEGYLSVAPSLINAIRLLVNEGYDVDVIIKRPMYGEYAPVPAFPAGVRILMDGIGSELHSETESTSFNEQCDRVRVRKYLPEAVRGWVARIKGSLRAWWQLIHFGLFSLRSVKAGHYKCFIGVDMHGLIAAFVCRLVKNVPVIYWSLEIRFLSDFHYRMEKILKRLERFCHRRAAFMIIQDEERATSLRFENKVSDAETVIVPNGPLGWPQTKTREFFHKKFCLAQNRRIILQLGMISPSVLSLEIAAEASNWNDDLALVFHERAKRAESDPYIDQVRAAGDGKVFLSLEPVPYDALDGLVMSGDIGLVFYRRELGANYSQIAGASGKLAHYLRCGLPVICLDLPGLAKLVDEYRCGICVSEPAEIESATEAIFRDYEFYRNNALRCYDEAYEFGRHFREVLRRIEEFGQSETSFARPEKKLRRLDRPA